MSSKNRKFITLGVVIAAIATGSASADVIETKNGARIVGKVLKITAGSVSIDTDYAGTLAIKQSSVASINTDEPVAIRLESGTRFDGKVTTSPAGELQVAGADGTITTTVAKVSASWPAGQRDPDVVAAEPHWSYEASVDATGKTGNTEQLGTSAAVRATLKTPRDTLMFYSAYDRQVSEGEKSADQFKAGVDYANNFSGKYSWYARDEGGFDRVKDIELYNVAAVGLGYDFLKKPKHILTGRAGLSFRYEGYKNPVTDDVKDAGLDFGLNHEWEFTNSKLVNRISYVPSFNDFQNYRINHESFYEMPLTVPFWKLRLGVANDHNSKPGPDVKRLDTSYFTRLVLSWK